MFYIFLLFNWEFDKWNFIFTIISFQRQRSLTFLTDRDIGRLITWTISNQGRIFIQHLDICDFFQRCALSCPNMTRDLAKWLCPFWKAAHFTYFLPLIFKVQSAFWNPGITNLLASVQICRNKIPYKLCFSFYWSDVRGNYLYHFDYWWFWCLSLDI